MNALSFTRRPTGTTREVVLLATPLVIQNLSYTLLGVADTLFVSRISTDALAAVGLANMIFFAVLLFFRGTANSSVVFIGRAYGEKNDAKIGAAVWNVLNVAAWLSLLVILLPFFFRSLFPVVAPPDSPAVSLYGTTYLQIRALEIPLSMFVGVIWGFLVGRGDSRTPMMLAWMTVLLNIFFDWMLVFGNLGAPALGVAGAAYATVLANIVNAVVGGIILWLPKHHALYGTRTPRLASWTELRSVLRVGLPMGAGDAIGVSAFSMFFVLLGQLGTNALAASQIAIQYTSLAFTYGIALSMAASSLVARHLGAQDPAQAERVGYRASVLGMVGMGIIGLSYLIAPHALMGVFTSDPVVIAAGVTVLRMAAIYQVFDALALVLGGTLNGAGDTRYTMVIKILFGWGIFIPLVWFLAFSLSLGVKGAWLGALLYLVLLAFLYGTRFRSGRWKTVQLA